jgi:hypothetical protein
MAQHDYDIANQSGANFRADLNNALDAIVSNNSGSSEPSTTFAYEWWIDTSANVLKLRNSANNAWITLPLSITADNSTSGALTVNGNLSTTGTVDINGQELILDADADTSITADTDDQIDFKIGGTDVATLTNSHLVLKGTTPKITIGDGGEEDTSLIFDGNAQDFYLGLDDTDDVLKIGTGSTLGTNRAIAITSTGSVGFGSDTGDVTSDGVASRTYVSILGTGNRGVLNIGSTASAGADGGKLSFVNGSNITGEIVCDPDSGSATNGNLAFNTTNAQRMKIDSSGNVGIGTSSPIRPLHVHGATSGDIVFAMTNNSSGATTSDGFNIIVEGPTPNVAIRNRETSNMLFYTANKQAFKIDSAGNTYKHIAQYSADSLTMADISSVNGVGGTHNAGGLLLIKRDTGNLRSISAAGSLNASGSDYAEYMTKSNGCGDIDKGDVVGVDANGKLTKIFNDSISFVIKSTDPSYVGGDTWLTENQSNPEHEDYINPKSEDYNIARANVDRIAFCGQVPLNITGTFNVGDYVYPQANGTGIEAVAKSNPTFEEYQLCVGKIWAIQEDGRPFVSVKIN